MNRIRTYARAMTFAVFALVQYACAQPGRTPGSGHLQHATPPACAEATHFESLILEHRARYPLMQAIDALKLLHHATQGSEHAITDTASVNQWMEREWANLQAGPVEPIIDTLGSSGKYARVHLRPYRAIGGDRARLLRAFIATARDHRGDSSSVACATKALVSLAVRNGVPWNADSLKTALDIWAAAGSPAVSHSPAFRNAYSPAYRVVALTLLPELLRSSPPEPQQR